MGLRNRHTKPTTNPYIAVGLVAVIITGIVLIGFKLSNGHQATALNHRLTRIVGLTSYLNPIFNKVWGPHLMPSPRFCSPYSVRDNVWHVV